MMIAIRVPNWVDNQSSVDPANLHPIAILSSRKVDYHLGRFLLQGPTTVQEGPWVCGLPKVSSLLLSSSHGGKLLARFLMIDVVWALNLFLSALEELPDVFDAGWLAAGAYIVCPLSDEGFVRRSFPELVSFSRISFIFQGLGIRAVLVQVQRETLLGFVEVPGPA